MEKKYFTWARKKDECIEENMFNAQKDTCMIVYNKVN